MITPKPGELLSHGQVCYILGMSKKTLNTWVRQGRISPAELTAGGHRRYRPEHVHALVPRTNR